MEQHKSAIRTLYGEAMNNRKLELLDSLVSPDYVNPQGIKGAGGFKQTLTGIITGFPDAHWTIVLMIAEGDRVFVKQQMTGTHKGKFQQFEATGKSVSVDGAAIYEFRDGKIIVSEIQTDRFSFRQQLGIN